MPEELPTGDKAVYVFLEILAFCFVLAFVDALVAQKPLSVSLRWLMIAIVFFLSGIKWPQIKRLFGGKVSHTPLPEFRPTILPVAYMKAEKDSRHGLYIRNPGYDALDVEIISARIGQSEYSLVFHERLAQFGERSGNAFFEAWLQPVQGKQLPLRGGGDLHEIMRNSDTEIVNFGIVYKDTDFRSYKTKCAIERTNRSRNGLEVKAMSQELVVP